MLTGSRGSILILSVWVLVFFSILSIGLYAIVSSQIKIVRALEEKFLCPYLVKSAYIHVKIMRSIDKTLSYDTLYELNQKQEKELGKGKFSYTLADEESKINVNNASIEVISRLPELNIDIARKITTSPLKPFYIKEQLLEIEGMSRDVYDKIKDYVTVYGEGVNINTASNQVLAALGISSGIIFDIEDFRNGPDGKEATEDDGVFKNIDEIISNLRLTGSQQQELAGIINSGVITIASNNLSMNLAVGILNRPLVKYTVIIDENKKIRQWIER